MSGYADRMFFHGHWSIKKAAPPHTPPAQDEKPLKSIPVVANYKNKFFNHTD